MTIDREELKEFLKNSVEWLQETDEGCCTYPLDDRLAVCVGWTSGWGEEQRDDCIQSKDNNDWAIDAGIKVYTSDDMRTDYEFINSPYRDNGEVATDDTAVTPKDVEEDYERLLDYLINEYEGLKDLTIEEDGRIVEKTTDYEEDDNIEESFRKVDEDLKVVCEFGDYKPWSGAVEVYDAIERAGKLDDLERLLEDAYPDGISMTGINDILWFDSDWVYENLGMTSEEDEEEDEDESLEEDKENIDESLSKGEKIAKLLAKALEGECGAFSGENPIVEGNKLTLYSQMGDESWIFNDDGSVDAGETVDELVSNADPEDYGCESEEELRDYFEEYSHFDSVDDLLSSGLDWFMYIEDEDLLDEVHKILEK